MIPILSVSGIGPRLAAILSAKGITTAVGLAATPPAELIEIPGIGAQRAKSLLAAAKLALEGIPPKPSKARKAQVPTGAPKALRKTRGKAKPAPIAAKVETAAAPENASEKADKKVAANKAKGKKAKTKKEASLKRKLKEKAAAKKAAAKKAEKKAAKKKAKASKKKKRGKSAKK